MFLNHKKWTINSVRNKRKISSFLCHIKNNIKLLKKKFSKKIYHNHKFLNHSNRILLLNLNNVFLGSHIIFKWLKLSYSNIFVAACYFADGTKCLRPASYGFSMAHQYKNFFISPFIFFNKWILDKQYFNIMTYNFIFFQRHRSMFFFVKNMFSNLYFAKSAGTFCVFLKFSKTLNLILLKLPSRKKKMFNILTVGLYGRNSNIFSKYAFYSSYGNKQKLKKSNITVRGVAMNPVDHPNGGSSKTKQPLRNPWGLIAKKGK